MTDVVRESEAEASGELLAAALGASSPAERLRLGHARARLAARSLHALVILAGISWAILFVVIGLRYDLQMYADGSIFSYAVAAQDAWAFHWHNISDRLFIYLFCYLPAETFVELSGSARGGIAIYGFLFFAGQLLGLLATLVADHSRDRIIFTYACLSTACLCPLVFGFPTEVWMAHALFWPALAACHYARLGVRGLATVFALLLALVFTHGGALIFAVVVLASLLLRGRRDAAFTRTAGAFLAVVSIWFGVKSAFPPDPYVAEVLHRAALHVFDISILGRHLLLLLFVVLAAYGVCWHILRRFVPTTAHVYSGLVIATVLAVYWLSFDHTLHAEDRYQFRTILLVSTPLLGLVAAAHALHAEERLLIPPALMTILANDLAQSAMAGAVMLVMAMHAVETAKFVGAWTHYEGAVRKLAMGTVSDPALGSSSFVSSDRIPAQLNRLSWFSTTPFLSIIVAPAFAPVKLVVDPLSNYFWLTCKTAAASEGADRAIPPRSRRLVRQYVCLHRLARSGRLSPARTAIDRG
jgi:hypothetical protein